MVGAPEKPLELQVFPLIMGKKIFDANFSFMQRKLQWTSNDSKQKLIFSQNDVTITIINYLSLLNK